MKIGIISQARMTSTRLPGKVLLQAGSKTMLQYHTERLQWSGLPIVIATTINATDDPIVAFAEVQQIPYYRGDEHNVLSRYVGAAEAFGFEAIVRVTSDCPLIDGNLIKEGVEVYREEFSNQLYISNGLQRSYPRGFDFEVFSYNLLKEAFQRATLPSDLEHVTPYIHQNRSGVVILKNICNSVDKSRYRITLDTEDDRKLIQILIERYGAAFLSYSEIIQVLDQHPELATINAHVEQKKLKRRIFFRADGNSQIGLGHVIRSLALADMLRDQYICVFAIREPSEALRTQIGEICKTIICLPNPLDLLAEAQQLVAHHLRPDDIVVLDGYHFRTAYQSLIKTNGNQLVCIDDIHDYHFLADVVINHAGGILASNYSTEAYTKLYLGLDYALLRKPFLELAKKKRQMEKVSTCFICMGGSDIYNLTYKCVEASLQVKILKKIIVITGSAFSHLESITELRKNYSNRIENYSNITAKEMANLMTQSQVAICPASSITFEIFCAGINLVTGFYVDNQKVFADYIHHSKLGINMGDLNIVSLEHLSEGVNQAIDNPTHQNQKKVVDGQQIKRMQIIFNKI